MAKKRFIFDESYIKRYAKRNKTRWLVVGVCFLLLIIVIIVVLLINQGNKNKVKPNPPSPVYEFKDELTIESGSKLPEAVDYFNTLENVNIDDIKISYPEEFEISYDVSSCSEDEINAINEGEDTSNYPCAEAVVKTPTTYGIAVSLFDEEHTVNLIVEDTMSPVVVTSDIKIFAGDEYEVDDFISLCYDVTGECEISFYEEDVDDEGNRVDYGSFTTPGEYTVKIIAKDEYDNETEVLEAKLEIVEPEKEVYSVIFDSNGGSAVPVVKVEDGNPITEPTSPSKAGYAFLGWYLNDIKFDFNNVITGNMTLTAKWEKIVENKPPVTGGNTGGPTTVGVTSVSINYSRIYLDIGQSKTMIATVTPSNATDKAVVWSSSNESIATVNNGVITGVSSGTAIITATAGGKQASVEVIVRDTSSTGCNFGNASYNGDLILTINLAKNNCAVNPNYNYNDSGIVRQDYQRLIQELSQKGLRISQDSYKIDTTPIRNSSGTGLVGYQVTITIKVGYSSSVYIIKPDGSRNYLTNGLGLN